MTPPPLQTRSLDAQGRLRALQRRELTLTVLEGASRGRREVSRSAILRIGSGPDNDIVLKDDSVSRRHAELELTDAGIVLRDLESTNGTFYEGCWVREVVLPPKGRFSVGETVLQVDSGTAYDVPLGEPSVGGIVGESAAIRECTALLERYAQSDAPVLITGETGTGKDVFARALHILSARREAPLEVFDCSAIAASLIESELFGHVRGAFTDAREDRAGIFERSDGGTLLLDEIGELPLELQPKLLRALETGTVRRLGADKSVKTNVRLVAATNRDLSTMVAEGRFRSDLYYRLNVLKIEVPPLRRRRDDIPVLCAAMMLQMSNPRRSLTPEALSFLMSYDWPGNVRELRNVLHRAMVLAKDQIEPQHFLLLNEGRASPAPPVRDESPMDWEASFHVSKERCIENFEREYLVRLLDRHRGRVVRAAAAAGISRQTLHRLMVRHDLATEHESPE